MKVRGMLLRTEIEEYEEGIMDDDHHNTEKFDLIQYWQVSATFTTEQLMIFMQRKTGRSRYGAKPLNTATFVQWPNWCKKKIIQNWSCTYSPLLGKIIEIFIAT